ncbi:thiamine pyrophosphate-binding protein [Occallatibacter savannae]|uniref:thiamine pyrophosphate-binding protein n=1 Tax=Occallatibacter savannae TaxID=1002691 RepID=UPI000D688FFC|nr:thiamine pyrophosphate-binding protein [Occallatibacter savannae]
MIKLSDYVMRFLHGAGIRRIFMLTGGGCMHLVDSVGRQEGLEYVCCLHEQACAFAAQAHAEFTSEASAVLVTTGPGGTNAVTGLASAWLDSTPCVFLSGQVKRADLMTGRGVRSMGPQELDVVSVVKPLTKYAKTIVEPNSIRYELEKAWHLVNSGRRGPVWLDIPLDVQSAMTEEKDLEGFRPEALVVNRDVLRKQVAETIEMLRKAERPVLFIGNGARLAYVQGLVGALVEKLKVPTLLTWKSMDMLPDEHSYFAGRPGSVASRGANFTQQNADCILVIGARLDMPQVAFSHRNFARGARKIVVDVDEHELAKLDMPVDVAANFDARDFVSELLRQLEGVNLPDVGPWLARTREWREKYPVILPEYWRESQFVNTYVLVDVLSDLCGPEDVLAPGSSGACSDIFLQCFRLKQGQRVVNSPTLGAMGTGLPGTIGTCLASDRRRTICVNGDGGFQLNIQDLETVRRLNLPIKYFILCNGNYASIITSQRTHFQGRLVGSDPSSHLTLPDVCKVAEAYGIASCEIRDHEGLREKVKQVLESPGPMVCAVNVSADQVTAPRATSMIRGDGTIVSLPMEDMAPRLPREEFRAQMIVPPLED